MTAEMPQRRTRTAREVAESLNCSERTVQRIMAEPRAEFLQRSHARQDHALDLKNAGLKYREIADKMGCTEKAAQHLVHNARNRRKLQALQDAPGINSISEPVLPGQTSIDDVPGE